MWASANGHALTVADADELVRAARAVTAGSAIFSPAVTRWVLAPLNGPRPLAPEDVPPRFERKRVILYPIRQRLLNPPIAGDLPVRRKSLANDVSSIFSKLQVADHAEAIVRARDACLDRGQRAR